MLTSNGLSATEARMSNPHSLCFIEFILIIMNHWTLSLQILSNHSSQSTIWYLCSLHNPIIPWFWYQIHSLSINNTHRSIQWLMSYTISNNPSPFSLTLYPNHQNTIHTQSWQWIQSIQKRRSHDRSLFWSYRSTLSIIILNTVKWFQYSIPHYSICLTHPSHTLSLVMKDSLLFVSIHRNLCPTNTLHCYHLYDCEISPYCFIIHSSIHTHGY